MGIHMDWLVGCFLKSKSDSTPIDRFVLISDFLYESSRISDFGFESVSQSNILHGRVQCSGAAPACFLHVWLGNNVDYKRCMCPCVCWPEMKTCMRQYLLDHEKSTYKSCLIPLWLNTSTRVVCVRVPVTILYEERLISVWLNNWYGDSIQMEIEGYVSHRIYIVTE